MTNIKRGVAPATPRHSNSRNMRGVASMRPPVTTPVAMATSPINALYAAGVGCSMRRWLFQAKSSTLVHTPCATAIKASARIWGEFTRNANASRIDSFWGSSAGGSTHAGPSCCDFCAVYGRRCVCCGFLWACPGSTHAHHTVRTMAPFV